MKTTTERAIEAAMDEYQHALTGTLIKNAARGHMAGDLKAHKRLSIDISFNLVQKEALTYSKEYGRLLYREGASMIQENTPPYRYKKIPWLKESMGRTRENIFKTINEGLKSGKPVAQIGGKRIAPGTIAHDLQKLIIREKDYEYVRIARSEVGRIQLEGSKTRYKANAVRKIKRLCGSNPCEEFCLPLCGKIFNIDEAPGLMHPNCVCDNAPIIER